ncbi:MAG: aa3-type cytochrome c oxidase subunit IV, partial [Alphaproteobacteria bacterium]
MGFHGACRRSITLSPSKGGVSAMDVDEDAGATAADEGIAKSRQSTWSGFVKLLTFCTLGCAIALILLAIFAL